MPSIFKFRRTASNAAPTPALQQGEMAINMAKRQLYLGTPSGNVDVIAIRFFTEDASYAVGDHVIRQGVLLRCETPVSPGPFNNANWGSAAGGVPDVPNDNITYVRRNGAWVQVTPALVGSPPLEPNDGKAYLRKALQWVEAVAAQISIPGFGTVQDFYTAYLARWAAQDDQNTTFANQIALRIMDAPSDGNSYVRNNAAWIMLGAVSGDVTGPAGGVADSDLVVFDGTTGKAIKGSGVNLSKVPLINQTNNWSGINNWSAQSNFTGSVSFTGTVGLPASTFAVTPATGDNSTRIATTAWVRTYVGGIWSDNGSTVTYQKNLAGFTTTVEAKNAATAQGSFAVLQATTGRTGVGVAMAAQCDTAGSDGQAVLAALGTQTRRILYAFDQHEIVTYLGAQLVVVNTAGLDLKSGEYKRNGVQLGYGNGLTGFGTVAPLNTGTAAGQIPVLDGSGNWPESVYPDDAFYFRAGSFKGFTFVNADGATLTAAEFGKVVSVGIVGAGPFVVNLPSSNSFGSGKDGGTILVENISDVANLIVRVPVSDFWYYPPAGLNSPTRDLVLGPHQTLLALARGLGEWNPIGGAWRTIQLLGSSATRPVATAAEYQNAAANRVLGSAEVWAAAPPEAFTTTLSPVTLDFSTAINFATTIVSPLGSMMLANPTNAKPGQSGSISITQGTGGGTSISFGTNWKFEGGLPPTLTITANAWDKLLYFVEAPDRIFVSIVKDIK